MLQIIYIHSYCLLSLTHQDARKNGSIQRNISMSLQDLVYMWYIFDFLIILISRSHLNLHAWTISFRQAPLLRQASDKMSVVLEQSTKARQLSIRLQQVEFAEELSKQLLTHATSMEKVYSSLIKATGKSASTTDGEFTKLFRTIEDKFTWFAKAEAL